MVSALATLVTFVGLVFLLGYAYSAPFCYMAIGADGGDECPGFCLPGFVNAPSRGTS